MENNDFLTEQIITYLGNKRSLLDFIQSAVLIVKSELGLEKISAVDVFSGSGVVSRFLKQHCYELHANDLEDYAETINRCYLTNAEDINSEELEKWFVFLKDNLKDDSLKEGFITKLYCPQDDKDIKDNERVFYKNRNGKYIDTCRQLLERVPEPYKTLFLGPLLYEASTKNNTSGVFKGFYKNSKTHVGQFGGDGKNALKRILADIEISKPVLSNYSSDVHVHKSDCNDLALQLPHLNFAYLDPPYNQHPYGSNYFMLNLINNYKEPSDISAVSGIPRKWNKSAFNTKSLALPTMKRLCTDLNVDYILISFNSEGFITFDEMVRMLEELGDVRVFDKEYNVYRASRNLNKRDIHLKEYLFLLRKGIKNVG